MLRCCGGLAVFSAVRSRVGAASIRTLSNSDEIPEETLQSMRRLANDLDESDYHMRTAFGHGMRAMCATAATLGFYYFEHNAVWMCGTIAAYDAVMGSTA